MLAYLYQGLHTFRKVFSRRATWLTFCLVVLGFIGAAQISYPNALARLRRPLSTRSRSLSS